MFFWKSFLIELVILVIKMFNMLVPVLNAIFFCIFLNGQLEYFQRFSFKKCSVAKVLKNIYSLPPGSLHKKNYKKPGKITIENDKRCSIVLNKTWNNNNLLPNYTLPYLYIYIYIYFSECLTSSSSSSSWQHGFPWLWVSIYPYHPLLPVGLLNSILCLRRTAVGKVFLVSQHCYVYV